MVINEDLTYKTEISMGIALSYVNCCSLRTEQSPYLEQVKCRTTGHFQPNDVK